MWASAYAGGAVISRRVPGLAWTSLVSETGYIAKELGPSTWPDFEKLFSKHGGVGGCWCMYYQRSHGGTLKGLSVPERKAANKRDKESLVNEGRAHGILLYHGNNPGGWCAYGSKTEFPRIDNGRNYRKLLLLSSKPTDLQTIRRTQSETPEEPENLWRIACFFVDRDYRKKGVARAGLKAVLRSIEQKGGGTVEADPVTSNSAKSWSKWSNWFWFWFGTSSMLEREVQSCGTHGSTPSSDEKND